MVTAQRLLDGWLVGRGAKLLSACSRATLLATAICMFAAIAAAWILDGSD